MNKVSRRKLWFGTLLALGACSSRKVVDVMAPPTDSVSSVTIYRKDETWALQNAALGVLPFFYGSARGLNLNAIRWNVPVTTENPGTDCDLTYAEGKGSSHYFRCIAKEGNSHIIVSLQEDLVSGRRMLRRIFMDGKGDALARQWAVALDRMGYKKSGVNVSGVMSRYVSPQGETIADIIGVSSSRSVNLRIAPKF